MTIGQLSGMTGGSKENLSAQKIENTLRKKVDFETLPRTEEAVRAFITEKPRLLIPGTDVEKVVAELKKSGFIVPEKKKAPEPEPEVFLETKYQKFDGGLKVIEDENLKKLYEENKFFESLKDGVFKNEKELEQTYEKSLELGKEHLDQVNETEEYYKEFTHLLDDGDEEVQKDLRDLKSKQDLFEKNKQQLEPKQAHRVEQAKKVATIMERGIVHLVSVLKCYGEEVSIKATSQFDDVKRGVDDVMQVSTEEADSFLALGIDVTYRGLLSEQYKQKFEKLLKSIQDGYATKIKYFKNRQGEPMKEFAIPKIVLFFDSNDVKDLVHMVQNVDNAEIVNEYKNSPMKFKILNQTMIQCELLAEFAEECKNPIFKKYQEMASSIKKLAANNMEIRKILDARHEDEVSRHMRYLINEFKGVHAVAA
jgi:hypothetical protein